MTASIYHRLDGIEPDNLLAFLALLGLLRALDADDRERGNADRLHSRTAWTLDSPPLRPVLVLSRSVTQEQLLEAVCRGIDILAKSYDFGGQKDLNYSRAEARGKLKENAISARLNQRDRVDLLAALTSDAAIKDDKDEIVDPTPLCLLFGQGHQHFLDRLASVPLEAAPPPRKRGVAGLVTAQRCLEEALFLPWKRNDPTSSFRWDPNEDVRYALMAGDPTDGAYKSGTQHGANRLATIGLGLLTVAPEVRAGRVRPSVIGGSRSASGFSFAWPVWRDPASLAAIRALLVHPALREPSKMAHLSVDHVLVSQRISVGKFMNFTRARPLFGRALGDFPHFALPTSASLASSANVEIVVPVPPATVNQTATVDEMAASKQTRSRLWDDLG